MINIIILGGIAVLLAAVAAVEHIRHSLRRKLEARIRRIHGA